MEMQALIEELAALVQKIKSGTATLGELEAFAAATSQLNERAIVLRYKAYEAQVYKSVETTEPLIETPELAVEVASIVAEETVDNETAQLEVEETADETAFDLFSMDEEDVEPTFELTMEEHSVFEAEEHEPVSLDPAPEMHLDALEPEIDAVIDTPESAPANEQVMESGDLHSIYTKLNNNDGSLAARLMTVRLETLKGAFGFNERLQIIQELFNGSNDEFSSLIEGVENAASKAHARQLVSAYASKFNWDEESSLALELIQKVERKYA